MSPREANVLLTRAALIDSRLRRVPEERAQMAIEWADVLASVPLELAIEAMREHYREQTRSIMPADIVALVADMPAAGHEHPVDAREWLGARGVDPVEFQARIEAGERPTRVLRELGSGMGS